MEHRPLVKVRLYMDVLLSLRGVPGIGVPPIMRETGVRFFMCAPLKKLKQSYPVLPDGMKGDFYHELSRLWF